jgi:hypothetical protein
VTSENNGNEVTPSDPEEPSLLDSFVQDEKRKIIHTSAVQKKYDLE